MTFESPNLTDLVNISNKYALELDDKELSIILSSLESTVQGYQFLDQMQEVPNVDERDPGYHPSQSENILGAWNWKSEISQTSTGILAGKKIAIKDNVAVAGLPLSNGSKLLADFIPSTDATVVQKILEAGGTIMGKATCENLCFSGGSHTSDSGAVKNPYDLTRSAGGSSSGSAALVANGEVDMAIGGDQGGSIRIPSSWCGIYGLKPTWGLVPYTGAFPIEPTLDHLGPMARNVEDLALLLETIVCIDGLDPRQSNTKQNPTSYLEELNISIDGLRVGIVEQGFGWPQSESSVDNLVMEQILNLQSFGVNVEKISIPLHRDAMAIWNGIGIEGALSTMLLGNGYGAGWRGLYDSELMKYWGDKWRENASQLPYTVKQLILMAEYLQSNYRGKYYAIAQNLSRVLSKSYDDSFRSVDILLMPTLPMTPTPLPNLETSLEELFQLSFAMLNNVAPFDISGHPAINIPIGIIDGLPVGLMAVAPKFSENLLLRLASAIEQNLFKMPSPLASNPS